MYKAVLFDLDGTLLHMDQNEFVKAYTGLLMKTMLPLGADIISLKKGFGDGVSAMLANDGSINNCEAYWKAFGAAICGDVTPYIDLCDAFYGGDYLTLKSFARENPHADALVRALKQKGCKVVLATNPVFPLVAQVNRLAWSGTSAENFDYITDYKSCHYCKPRPEYYLEICKRIGVEPCECLMVGNDASDDMKGASEAGMDCYLATDCLIETDSYIWQGERGTFAELTERLTK
ncbi:MAG: HAD family hydrolase [Ruminococcaceae bacterium]|nr:HAD family hydrolase [Oscillospiraceae bacterium]